MGQRKRTKPGKIHNGIREYSTIKSHGVSGSVSCTFLLTSPSESLLIFLNPLLDIYKDSVALKSYFNLLKNFFALYKCCLCSSSDVFSLRFLQFKGPLHK